VPVPAPAGALQGQGDPVRRRSDQEEGREDGSVGAGGMENRPDKNVIRTGRKSRYRDDVVGAAHRPRLAVYRSLNHIYVQAIDDAAGAAIAPSSSGGKGGRQRGHTGGGAAAA